MNTLLNRRPRLSRWLLGYVAVLALTGLTLGALLGFRDRRPVRAHVPAENAWPVHIVISCAVAVLLAALCWRHRHRLGSWLTAPLSVVTAGRIRSLLWAAGRGRPNAVLRLALSVPPFALVSWCAFRAALQITVGFDPNQVINAWGGPSYLGAMYCHYLDATAMTLPALYLLHLLLPPADQRAGR